MKTKNTIWTVNVKNEVEIRNTMDTLLSRWECFTPKNMIDKSEVNAKLIAEAGNVANETGLTPRQLLEQRNEMLEALVYLRDKYTAFVENCNYSMDADIKALSAIKKATE